MRVNALAGSRPPMITKRAMLVCPRPRAANWQLEPPAIGRFVLLGWQVSPDHDRDGGVPDEIASVLARSLTRVALVTFPRSSLAETATSWEEHVRTLQPTGWGERLRDAFERRPSRFFLVSTHSPDIAKTLFHDGGFPWGMQGQVILLGAPDARPPEIDRRTLLSLITDANRPLDLDALGSMGVAAIVRPGVDGDVAGLMSSTEALERQILSAIHDDAVRVGLDWRVLSEDAFGEQLAARGN